MGLDGRQLTLKSADIEELRTGLRGELITADQPAYEGARRLWNPAFDRKPLLIVRCVGAADVRRAVNFAAAHGILTAVRGGGHSVSGQSGCDGGLVIDVSPMRAVEVDPVAKLARVEGGALLGQLDRETLAALISVPRAVGAIDVEIPSPVRRLAISGRNHSPTGCVASGTAAASFDAASTILRVTAVSFALPC